MSCGIKVWIRDTTSFTWCSYVIHESNKWTLDKDGRTLHLKSISIFIRINRDDALLMFFIFISFIFITSF